METISWFFSSFSRLEKLYDFFTSPSRLDLTQRRQLVKWRSVNEENGIKLMKRLRLGLGKRIGSRLHTGIAWSAIVLYKFLSTLASDKP